MSWEVLIHGSWEPGPNPTNMIALRLSLSLGGSPLTTEHPDVIEISLSAFLIACDASYQKYAQFYFYASASPSSSLCRILLTPIERIYDSLRRKLS